MRVLIISILLLVSSANSALTVQSSVDGNIDLIIFGGEIITMDPQFPAVEAVLINGGTIKGIGTLAEIQSMANPDVESIDLEGNVMFPGFIDSHAHWIGDQNIIGEFENGIDSALSYGWTSITEMFTDEGRLETLIELDSNSGLRVRVNTYLPLNFEYEYFGDWWKAYPAGHEYSDRLRIAGLKIFNDRGPLIGYNEREYFHTQEQLNAIVKEGHDLGYQIGIHTIVDNSTDIVLNAFINALDGEDNSKYRHRIEHGIMLREDQLQLMNEHGIILSYQFPWVNADWVDVILDDPGIDHVNEVGNWRRASEIGVLMIGSTDRPWDLVGVTGPVMEGIHKATTRIGSSGATPPEWMANKTLEVEKVLKSITIDAAYGTFQEDVKGSVTVNKFADFVVLSENPINSNDILFIDTLMTIVGGNVEYCNDDLTNICEAHTGTETVDFYFLHVVMLMVLFRLFFSKIKKIKHV